MKQMVYVGEIEELKGKTALVRDDPESKSRGVLVQFDVRGLKYKGVQLAYHWHSFYSYEFEPVRGE